MKKNVYLGFYLKLFEISTFQIKAQINVYLKKNAFISNKRIWKRFLDFLTLKMGHRRRRCPKFCAEFCALLRICLLVKQASPSAYNNFPDFCFQVHWICDVRRAPMERSFGDHLNLFNNSSTKISKTGLLLTTGLGSRFSFSFFLVFLFFFQICENIFL